MLGLGMELGVDNLWKLVYGRELGVDLGIDFGSLLTRSAFFGVDL